MRLVKVSILVSLLLAASTAIAAIVLTTPITVPNVQRWKVTSFQAVDDEVRTTCTANVQFIGTGAITYREFSLTVFDTDESTILSRTASPDGYMDRVAVSWAVVSNACLSLITAWESVPRTNGWRAARLRAIETALLSTGVVDSSLTGTQ